MLFSKVMSQENNKYLGEITIYSLHIFFEQFYNIQFL
jgi:hypothetical protein